MWMAIIYYIRVFCVCICYVVCVCGRVCVERICARIYTCASLQASASVLCVVWMYYTAVGMNVS